MEPPVSDPRFTLPASPELLARAEAVARERTDAAREALRPMYGGALDAVLTWGPMGEVNRRDAVAIELHLLRDLTRPASYDAAIRWLAELIVPGSPADSWTLFRLRVGWALCREYDGESVITVAVTDNDTADRREALVLALTAALEARR
jgi:hypothetical protein